MLLSYVDLFAIWPFIVQFSKAFFYALQAYIFRFLKYYRFIIENRLPVPKLPTLDLDDMPRSGRTNRFHEDQLKKLLKEEGPQTYR